MGSILRAWSAAGVDLLAVRTAEKQRVEKLLEDPLIKLSVVVSDPFGASVEAPYRRRQHPV